MFASKTIAQHLVRGALGIGAFVIATLVAPAHPLLALALLPAGLVALRGCPMCWTIGLAQTASATLQGKSRKGLCVDGRCQARQ